MQKINFYTIFRGKVRSASPRLGVLDLGTFSCHLERQQSQALSLAAPRVDLILERQSSKRG
jgi:hypothetical protein